MQSLARYPRVAHWASFASAAFLSFALFYNHIAFWVFSRSQPPGWRIEAKLIHAYALSIATIILAAAAVSVMLLVFARIPERRASQQ